MSHEKRGPNEDGFSFGGQFHPTALRIQGSEIVVCHRPGGMILRWGLQRKVFSHNTSLSEKIDQFFHLRLDVLSLISTMDQIGGRSVHMLGSEPNSPQILLQG